MAIKVTQLPSATVFQDADLFMVVQDGASKKAAVQLLQTWVQGWITKGDVGLDQVENIAPEDMPISDDVQAALDVLSDDIDDVASDLAALLVDSLADGDTIHAPTANIVFDSLAEKVAKAGDTMTGALLIHFEGSLASPNIKMGVTDQLAIYGVSDGIGFAYNGVAMATFTPGSFAIQNAGGSATTFSIVGESTTAGTVERNSTDSTGPAVSFRKSRGTIAARTIVATNDTVGSFNFNAYDGVTSRTVGTFHVRITEATPSTTAMGSQYRFSCYAPGTVTSTEALRMDHTNGLQGFGANTFLTTNRALVTRGGTLATLNAFTRLSGSFYYCSDLGGGSGFVIDDGTRLKRIGNRGQTTVSTDADFTLTPLTSAGNIKHTGTLTADRTITLSTSGVGAGDEFTITRTGSGAFNLSVGGLKNLVTDTWARVIYDGSAWYLAAYGAL